ncbi:hypothetical protein FACS1894172_02800 [Spirochaetia bacterium]|nr:hypothetical protein FACS1894164_20080 [Spirochaetia bacterium]GHU30160.1 hypothetical protein FACS1894172_02800 [Spirochaetia bacterium]
MHVEIYLLTPAEDYADAKSRVEWYLENETFYDHYTVLKEKSDSLEEKRAELIELREKYDCRKLADDYLAMAEEQKVAGNMSMAGYYYRRAGSLYEELLTDATVIYNIDFTDYSIPDDTHGWFAIAVDFHV